MTDIAYYRNKVSSLPTFGRYYIVDERIFDKLSFVFRDQGSTQPYRRHATSEMYISQAFEDCFYFKNFLLKSFTIECSSTHGRELNFYVIDCNGYTALEPNYGGVSTVLSNEDIADVYELSGSCNTWGFF
jgi:hypothetical protein